MQTLLIELKNKTAYEELHNLEVKNIIRIVKDDFSSVALSGDSLDVEDFRKWVEYAENTPTVSLTEAKQIWKARKKKLQRIIR